ncbi:MAG: hypothetical protein HUK21_07165 [Fibrobacteraceae bacterium]|nr:hypothetical protein [Fibrobacteraceae bacterium]
MCQSNEDKNRLTKKELYQLYWHCRDFEIDKLWQRAMLLAPMLILCYTGYGAFFIKSFVDNNGINQCLCDGTQPANHIIALLIACMGMILSVFWILMMKASKAWVEVYEQAISAMDSNGSLYPKGFENAGDFHMEKLPEYKKANKFNSCIFSTKGGCFSPSRINIAVGIFSFVVCFFLFIFHSINYFCFSNFSIIFLFIAIVVLLSLVLFWRFKQLKSSSLEEKDSVVSKLNL